jgi:hypothetical protein
MIAFTQINPRVVYDTKFYHMFAKLTNAHKYHEIKTGNHFSEPESLAEFRLEFIL